MNGHCQHNLYICHCTPSSSDPSPIHPMGASAAAAAAAAAAACSGNSSTASTSSAGTGSTAVSETKQPKSILSKKTPTAATNPMLIPALGCNSPTSIATSAAHVHQEKLPVYVTQTSVAVMTSPTLNLAGSKTSASLGSLTSLTTPSTTGTGPDLVAGQHQQQMFTNTIPRVIVKTNGSSGASNLIFTPSGPPSRSGLIPMTATTLPLNTHMHIHHDPLDTTGHMSPTLPTGLGVTTASGAVVTTSQSRQHSKLLNCHNFITRPPRTCLERVVFSLLTLILVIVFLVAALLVLFLGSSSLDGGRGASGYALVFGGGPEGMIDPGRGSVLGPEGLGSLGNEQDDDGIEIVRIKTTEEKVVPNSNGQSRTVVRTKKVCVTAECSEVSRRILQNVNPEIDPCDSFYQFACGGWMMKNQPPPRRMVHSVMSQMRDNVDRRLRDLIEGLQFESPLDPVDTKLRTFYESCMDDDTIRKKGSSPAVDFIHKTFSKWIVHSSMPYLYAADASDRRDMLTKLLLALIQVNGTPLFDVSLDLAPRNASRYVGVIRVPQRAGLLPRLMRSRRDLALFNKWVRQRRRKRNSRGGQRGSSSNSGSLIQHDPSAAKLKLVPRQEIFRSFQNALNAQRVTALVKTAETIGILDTASEKLKQNDIDEILGFLAALEKVLPSEKEIKKSLMNNAIFNEYNIEELEAAFKYVNWGLLLEGLFPKKPEPHEVLLVHNPTYMRRLGRIISLFEPRVVWKSILVLYAKDVLADLITVHHGQSRWQYCTQVSAMLFGEALARLYTKATPLQQKHNIEKKVSTLFEKIRRKILDDIDSTPWMREPMKAKSKEKIEKLKGDFVGSDIYLNQTFLENRYKEISVTSDYFSNVMTMFSHFRRNLYHFLHIPVENELYTWSLIAFPFTVNAFHLQQLNSIVIPQGLLQDAHYTPNVPQYLNLGSLGLTLAHETLHSLDTTGREFNANGVHKRWWDASSEHSYKNVSSCFVDQYQNHFQRPLRIDARSILVEVDGTYTLNENVCDVDGMHVASEAFMSLPNSPDSLVYLPNNPYNPEQLFFINAAQSYCSHLGPVSYVLYLELDEHSPNPERVDGFMMNSEMFSRVFQCPVGSRMNPQKKCSIWS